MESVNELSLLLVAINEEANDFIDKINTQENVDYAKGLFQRTVASTLKKEEQKNFMVVNNEITTVMNQMQ